MWATAPSAWSPGIWGDRIQVEKNPRFWDAKNVCIDRINYYPTPDLVSAERRVQRGELDINTSFQSNRLAHMNEVMPGYARPHMSLATYYLSFNTPRPRAAAGQARAARAVGSHRPRLHHPETAARRQVPAYSFVPPGTANYTAGAEDRLGGMPLVQRQIEARALLAQLGYNARRPLKLEIKTQNATDSLLLAEAVQADWRAIGVDASVAQNDSAIAFAAYRNRDFQVGAMSWYADFNDPVTFLGLLKSDVGAQNYGDYKNPAYDALLDQADREPDATRRAQILARAEQTMLDDEGMAPIYFIVNRNIVNPKITGWVANSENFHRARWFCVKR